MKNESQPLVSIIILNYNAGKLIEECIDSIFHSNYRNYEIIVVDNNSKDDTKDDTKSLFMETYKLHIIVGVISVILIILILYLLMIKI